MMTALLILIVVDIWATVVYARRAEAAANDAAEMCRGLIYHFVAQPDDDTDAKPRRRHL